ncbi:MAG: hypothetical protein JRI59_11515 [Deltaproteobacteria bacterium]|nr:hypothetical protein [Deltaproteobacteria bacterium]
MLIVAFLVYILGLLKPYLPLEEIPRYWTQSSHHYLEVANIQPGWAWLGKLKYADFLIYVPIAILAGSTIVCYVGVIFKFIKSKETVLVVIAILEVLVLLAAASGLLKVGH